MLRGIYTVASAMESAARNQDLVAENLAHAVTPGYRKQGAHFEIEQQVNATASPSQNANESRNLRGYSNFESGPLQQTSHPFDFAVVGDAFFVVEGPNGPLYTRNGCFERNGNGELQQRGSGYRVRGSGGAAIRIPTEAAHVTVSPTGSINANGVEVGRLDLARFERTDAMRRVGPSLFEADGAQAPPPGTVRVEQGYYEGSNVQAVQEMVSMMVGMRYYEAAERAMRSLSDAISQNTRAQA